MQLLCLPQVHQASVKLPMKRFLPHLSNAKSQVAQQVSFSRRPWSSCRWHHADSCPENAVANFFTPVSSKPKDRTIWTERGPNDDAPATLLVGRYDPEGAVEKTRHRPKIAAFDLDSTLITTMSGNKFAKSGKDWKWWNREVPDKLRKLHQDQGYQIVILSNQKGLTLHFDANFKGSKASKQQRVTEFKQKCSAILNNLNLPITLYAATASDGYRKPRTGMWKELCEDLDILEADVDLEHSIFVGDAGGRAAGVYNGPKGVVARAKDFSCSDRNFAYNVGIDYKTPEEFFLGEQGRYFSRDFDLADFQWKDDATDLTFEKKNKQDIVLFCGPPGAGKSTFFWNLLKPLGYERVNQDILKSREKCFKVAQEHLKDGKSVGIDNTNPDTDVRATWIDIARNAKVPIRCVWFKTPLLLCEHNDAVRSLNASFNPETRTGLPKIAFTGFKSRYKPPQLKEGFQDITEVDFTFRGTKEEHEIWARYWI